MITKNLKQIASGGEGTIYEHPKDSSKVLKIYHTPRNIIFKDHLLELKNLSDKFLKPIDIIEENNKVIGFTMNYINFNDYYLLNNLFNKGFCNNHSITDQFKTDILSKMKSDILDLHSKKLIIGDLNQYNIFFSTKGDLLYVDVDSYQSAYNKHSGVLLDEIRDWTNSNIDSYSDSYSYDVLSFWILTYCHPYKYLIQGSTTDIKSRCLKGESILTKKSVAKIPPIYKHPVGDIYDQFFEIFDRRKRFFVDFKGTNPGVLIDQSITKNIVTSDKLSIREIASDVTKVNSAFDQFAVLVGDKWTLYKSNMKSLVSKSNLDLTCDELYPSNSNYCYRVKNVLYDSKGKEYKFSHPEFHYKKGSLMVIDYSNDSLYNYEIDSQLYGINYSKNPIYSRSVVHKTEMIQNFGKSKFINSPNKSSYSMIKLPESTLDAYNVGEIYVAELRVNNTIIYRLFNKSKSTDLSYLPKFDLLGDKIVVPNDNSLDIYDLDLNLIMKFDCNVSSIFSQIHVTQSGIILLEDKKLYLINTK
jgi:hypothetical protein